MHRPLLVVPLLLFLVTACRAAAAEVRSQYQLCAALSSFVEHIDVTTSFAFRSSCPGKVRHQVVIKGYPGVVLNVTSAAGPVLDVSNGSLVIRSIALATVAGQFSTTVQGPVPQIVSSGGLIVYDRVVFLHSTGQDAQQQLPYWVSPAESQPLQSSELVRDSAERGTDWKWSQPKRVWRVRDWEAGSGQGRQLVVNSSVLLLIHACDVHGSALVYDIGSLDAAVLCAGVHRLTVVQDFVLEAAQCSRIRHVLGSRGMSISSCCGANRAAQQIRACLAGADAEDTATTQPEPHSSRKLLQHQQQSSNQQHASQRGAVFSAGIGRRQLAPAAAAGLQGGAALQAAAEVQPQKTQSAARTAADSSWLSTNRAAIMADKYPKGRCFTDAGSFSFSASNAAELKRLLSDNAATHIELTGDIVLTADLFPPEEANDRTKGVNITHHVDIRACTGDVNAPIIVDVNNLQQQIYVYGFMRWAGNIKFINSYPSPRRAGMWPLISILSVEEDGIVEFEDLEMHGSEPCPLFDPSSPFWTTYDNEPLSRMFVPQPADFKQLSPSEVLLLNYKFNKSAWVMATQGPNGVSLAVGDGYWHWIDVMTDYSTSRKTVQGILAIVLPVVLGSLVLIGAAVGVWLWRRAASAASSLKQSTSAKDVNLAERNICVSDVNDLLAPSQTITTQRQYSTFDSMASKLDASKPSVDTQELIEEARRRMQCTGSMRRETSIVLEGLLGEGTFGKVYRGQWQGTDVAVKTMLFPAAMSGKEKREKMAIMETAISSSLSHPNIVQTYTYVVKPLTGELALQAMDRGKGSQSADESEPSTAMGSDSPDHHGWEVRLVLEYCDRGSLKDMLNSGSLRNSVTGKPDMVAVVATALDIARAMLHLHSENVIHSDLKARNVLLKSAGADARGFVAKVSDFGLSVKMDPSETHVSNVYQGTLTHMAPEVLMYGKISRASDVYAYGILLWELYTGQQAFKGTPRVLLGHEVTKMGRRPEFPEDCPFDYQLLACRCWESDPAIRPSFQQILADLQRMASKLTLGTATSFPQHAAGVAGHAGGIPSGQQQQHLAMTSTAGVSTGVPAACGLDPLRLHNWEPQTSLLDLNSVDSTKGSSVPAVMDGSLQQQQPAAGGSQGPHSSLSWGNQSHGGFWLGGSLAPSNVPSDVQLPLHPITPDSSADTPAGLSSKLEAPGLLVMNGQAAGCRLPLQQQQQQQHHWCPDIHMPVDLLPQQHSSHLHQQHTQAQLPSQQDNSNGTQQLPAQYLHLHSMDHQGIGEPKSVSSNRININEQSSSVDRGPHNSLGPEQQQEVASGGAAIASGRLHGMMSIAEDGECEQQQPTQQQFQEMHVLQHEQQLQHQQWHHQQDHHQQQQQHEQHPQQQLALQQQYHKRQQ